MTTTTTDARARQAMADYLDAGARFDLDELTAYYGPGFANIRTEADGTTIRIDREELIAGLAQIARAGGRLGPIDDVSVLATAQYGPFVSVVLRRIKAGRELLYNFVWDLAGDRPQLVQEFTATMSRPQATVLLPGSGPST